MEEEKVSESSKVEECDATKEIWCLKRVGENSGWLRLFENTEVTLGRALNVTYQLLSPNYPLMISRNHCLFKQNEDGQWTVTDKKSLNGVWVNRERIIPEKAWQLSTGDSVRIGVPVESTQFEYVLVRDNLQTLKPFLQPRTDGEANASTRTKKTKRKLDAEGSDPAVSPESKAKLYRCSSTDKSLGRPCPAAEPARPRSPRTEAAGPSAAPAEPEGPEPAARGGLDLACLRRDSASIQALRNRLQDARQEAASLQALRPGQREELEELRAQQEALRAQLRSQQEQHLRRVQTLEDSLCQEEMRLEVAKRQEKEENLKKQLEEALQEHRKVIEELRSSRQGFEEMLQAKDKELKVTKEEKEQARAQKEEVVIQMTDVLENELQCIICSELFIEAVTLSCAHSFCLHCIEAWRKRSGACPICRQDILSQTRSLVLDNCIDRMVESLSAELKERRQELISQRKGESPACDRGGAGQCGRKQQRQQ
ncbi:hypothetical protein MATL_G00201630 [Megalops atlanticus]|uniref:E3 ubiquitin-protein ligase CHFR n=1 Tax=Megalops atlanticus TaxID=7932 RepID=A0A9D3T4M6_MEGAT|nr:hypothetical protein MATL_G00201630 [Megalops atlanticus]